MDEDKNLDMDFSSLEDAMRNLQDAYSGGLSAMNQAGKEAEEDLTPSHRVIIDVCVSALVEGHVYKNDVHLEFLADLEMLLNAEGGDIASLLLGLGLDINNEESGQIVEQIGKPKGIAVLDKILVHELELHGEKGKINYGINKDANMLITLDEEKLHFSFESVFALADVQSQQTLFYAIPSQEQMQKHVVLRTDALRDKISFKWSEADKDNLKIDGSLSIVDL